MQETIEIVPVNFEKVAVSQAYTCIVFGTEEKKFGIYTDPASGKAIQTFLSGTEKPRPQTHDMIGQIFKGFDIKLKHIVINELEETLYFARLFLEQQSGEITHIVEIDARPSDCIILALMHKVPVFCAASVIEKAIPYEE